MCRYRSGTQASIECEDGYELRGSGHAGIICKEDGSWQPINQKEFPLCKEKACQYPDSSIPVIENGSLEINGNRQGPNSGYKPGSVAVYHCHPGFVLLPFSAGKLVCHRGIWEGSIPACVSPQSKPVPRRSHCPSPTSIPNGYYITDTDSDTPLALPVSERGQYERGTIARYHCQEGYILRTYQGQDTYRCMANGIWSPKVPPGKHTVRNLHFLSKNSTLISWENCRFFEGEKLVKILWFCQNWIFGQKFDFSNSVTIMNFEIY